MAKLEHTLNYVNLWLEGVSLQHDCTTKQERVAKYEDVSDNDVVNAS